MKWYCLEEGLGVLELPGLAGFELELAVWWGGGEPTRAAWLWSQTGSFVWWCGGGQT